jgi:hypothetical protein
MLRLQISNSANYVACPCKSHDTECKRRTEGTKKALIHSRKY